MEAIEERQATPGWLPDCARRAACDRWPCPIATADNCRTTIAFLPSNTHFARPHTLARFLKVAPPNDTYSAFMGRMPLPSMSTVVQLMDKTALLSGEAPAFGICSLALVGLMSAAPPHAQLA